MGIENRDYVRGGSPSGYGGSVSYGGGYSSGGMPPACKWILIITIAVFILQLLWTAGPSDSQVEHYREQRIESLQQRGIDPGRAEEITRREIQQLKQQRFSVLQQAFELAPDKVVPGLQVWRLVTYAFCHSDSGGMPWHIIFNMFAFWLFAPTLERMYGTREFIWFYLVGAAVSGLAFMLLEQFFLGSVTPVIGASGAVMAVLMLYAVHYPRQIIRIWGIIPIEVRWIVGIFIVVDLFPVLRTLGGNMSGDNVAHSAHLGGLAFGYLYHKFHLRFEGLFAGFKFPEMSSSRKPPSRKNLKLYQPPDNFEERVDAILEKISQQGEASLTDQERQILKDASKRYKNRS